MEDVHGVNYKEHPENQMIRAGENKERIRRE
jgi:hypothetical protein